MSASIVESIEFVSGSLDKTLSADFVYDSSRVSEESKVLTQPGVSRSCAARQPHTREKKSQYFDSFFVVLGN